MEEVFVIQKSVNGNGILLHECKDSLLKIHIVAAQRLKQFRWAM